MSSSSRSPVSGTPRVWCVTLVCGLRTNTQLVSLKQTDVGILNVWRRKHDGTGHAAIHARQSQTQVRHKSHRDIRRHGQSLRPCIIQSKVHVTTHGTVLMTVLGSARGRAPREERASIVVEADHDARRASSGSGGLRNHTVGVGHNRWSTTFQNVPCARRSRSSTSTSPDM